jgi:hypothetical protein
MKYKQKERLPATKPLKVSLLLTCQRRGLVHFFRYWALLPIGWKIAQILRQRQM